MSAQNVEIVRRMCHAYARRDWDAAAEPLHPEIELDAASYALWPDTEVTRGKQEVHGARGGVPLNRLPSGPGGPWTNMCSIC